MTSVSWDFIPDPRFGIEWKNCQYFWAGTSLGSSDVGLAAGR